MENQIKRSGKKIIKKTQTLYLVDFHDDECYQIFDNTGYEYAEIRKPICNKETAKKIFDMLTKDMIT